jgi:hypothetical protein
MEDTSVESDLDRTMREAEASLGHGMLNIPAMLADRVGSRAGATAIFGDAVERDGVTVIPVAKVAWGFGGGGGKGSNADGEEEGEGSGGGGGAIARPAGYIQISGGGAEYKSIGSPFSTSTILAIGFATYLALKGVRALVR